MLKHIIDPEVEEYEDVYDDYEYFAAQEMHQQKGGINNETRKLDRSRFTQMQANLDGIPETARYHRSYWTDGWDRSEKWTNLVRRFCYRNRQKARN